MMDIRRELNTQQQARAHDVLRDYVIGHREREGLLNELLEVMREALLMQQQGVQKVSNE